MSKDLQASANLANERLEKSRALLRKAMQRPSGDRAPAGVGPSRPGWITSLKSFPAMTVLVEAISSWWMRHPLRVVTLIAKNTTRLAVHPLARRHPLSLVLGALALGAFMVWSRPWRWILKPAIFAGLLSQLVSKGIAHLPLESWLTDLSSSAWKVPSVSSNGSATPPPM